MSILGWLQGKRSYFIGAALFIVGGLRAVGWITAEQAATLTTIFGGLAVVALRSAVKKVQNDVADVKLGVSELPVAPDRPSIGITN